LPSWVNRGSPAKGCRGSAAYPIPDYLLHRSTPRASCHNGTTVPLNRLLKPFGGDGDPISAEDALVAIIGERDKARVLLPYFTLNDIRAGDPVFHEGDDADGLILLVRGNLSAHLDLGGGQFMRLRKFLPGTLMGEMAFYTGSKRSASLVADTDATIGVISSESIRRLSLDQPAVAAEFHQMTARLMANRIMSMNAMLRTLLAGIPMETGLGAGEAIE
jgi:CRP-like cAMP-binding protein